MVDIVQNKKRRLFIIGASHLGRELESWLDLVPETDRDWELVGFLHNYEGDSPLNGYPSDYDILGRWDNFSYQKNDLVLLGVADVAWREKIYETLKDRVEFLTFIFPNTVLGKFCKIGKGVVVSPNCTISTNVTIEDGVFINSGSQIGHDVEIGKYSSIMANVDLAGHVCLGKRVFVGSNAIIIPKRKICDNVKVGAGSVVIRNVKKNGISIFGNPAIEI